MNKELSRNRGRGAVKTCTGGVEQNQMSRRRDQE